jgi:hypothetical protein
MVVFAGHGWRVDLDVGVAADWQIKRVYVASNGPLPSVNRQLTCVPLSFFPSECMHSRNCLPATYCKKSRL